MVTTLGEVGPVRERKGPQRASGIPVMFLDLDTGDTSVFTL